MRQILLLFIALLCASGWLYQKTRLPDVAPLSNEELKAALTEKSAPERSLTNAFENAANALAQGRAAPMEKKLQPTSQPKAQAPSETSEGNGLLSLSEAEMGALPGTIVSTMEARPQDAAQVGRAFADAATASSRDASDAPERARVISAASSLYSNADASAKAQLSAGLSTASIRVLEVPSNESPQPVELQCLREASGLLHQIYGNDAGRINAVYGRIKGLHPSAEAQAALSEIAPPEGNPQQ